MDSLAYWQKADAAYQNGEYETALSVVADAESEGKASAELLLLKGACIQLATGTDFPVGRALDVYLRLLDARPNDPRILTEIGFYQLKVEDKPVLAKEFLDRALGIYEQLISEVLHGRIEALRSTGMTRESAVAEAKQRLGTIADIVEQRVVSEQR